MLKIKCFRDFHGYGVSVVLICGDATSFDRAAKYLANKDGASLDDPNFAIYYDNDIITRDMLKINKKECAELSGLFYDMQFQKKRHDYYDIQTLEHLLDVELKISHGEYPDKIFEEWT